MYEYEDDEEDYGEEVEVRDLSWLSFAVVGKMIHQKKPLLPTELWDQMIGMGIDKDEFFDIIFSLIQSGQLNQTADWKIILNRNGFLYQFAE